MGKRKNKAKQPGNKKKQQQQQEAGTAKSKPNNTKQQQQQQLGDKKKQQQQQQQQQGDKAKAKAKFKQDSGPALHPFLEELDPLTRRSLKLFNYDKRACVHACACVCMCVGVGVCVCMHGWAKVE